MPKELKVRASVIGKTKLGESDLIVRLLAEDGSKIEAVAKGARKPQSHLSSKLELFNESELLIHEGRSLGIVKECRLLDDFSCLSGDVFSFAAAAGIAEFVAKTTQPDLEAPRLYDLFRTALSSLKDASAADTAASVAAMLLKASAISGMRPQLNACVVCGDEEASDGAHARISFVEGGIVCPSCSHGAGTASYPASIVRWADWLISNPFAAIPGASLDSRNAFEILGLATAWAEAQFDIRLKSIRSLPDYLL